MAKRKAKTPAKPKTDKKTGLPVVRAKRRSEREDDEDSWQSADPDNPNTYDRSSTKWWLELDDGKEAMGKLFTWIERLRMRWAIDSITDLVHEAVYADEPIGTGFDGQMGAFGFAGARFPRSAPANLNIVMSLVDTAGARLCKRRPMPVVSADDAGWTEKRFAKKTSRILRRKMGGPEVERESPTIVRDMLIRGTAVAMTVRDGGDTRVDRIPIGELVWDPREAFWGQPRTVAWLRPMPREVMMARYPEFADEIRDAPAFNRVDPWMMYAYQGPTIADMVEVATSWHLPSAPGAKDGQVIEGIRGCPLMRRRWKRPRYPFARAFWSAPQRSFRGKGLVQQLAGIQCKINDILRDAQEALYYASQLKIFLQRGSNVIKNHLRARHPAVVEFDGAEPHFVAGNPVSEQALKILMMLIEQARTLSGISEMAQAGKNQLGANASGKALDTMDDLQTDRFADKEIGYGQFRCEIGMCQIDEARDMWNEANGKDEVESWEFYTPVEKKDLAPWIDEHDWSKVDIDSGNYHLTLEPINFLPDSRAGKLSFVAELSKAGLIPDPTMTASLFDEPDLARMNRSVLGPMNNIERMLEDIADGTVAIADCLPSSYSNKALFLLMAKGEIEDAMAMRADQDVIERYDQAIKYCKDMMDMEASPSLPGMQSAQMGPSPNAATLQPGMGGPPGMPPPGMPPMGPGGPMPPMNGVPPGMAA